MGDTCSEPVCRQRDVVFVMDNSFSLNATDFNLEKGFVVDFMKNIRDSIGDCRMRFAVVKYGYDVETEFDFTFTQNPTELIKAVRRMKRPERFRGTRTATALREALQLLRADGRPSNRVDWTIILLSDGKSTDDKNNALQKIIDRLNTAGVLRFSMGIGLDVDIQELVKIAGDRARTLLVETFADLATRPPAAAQSVCNQP